MKQFVMVISILILGAGVQAQSPMHGVPAFGAEDLLALVPGLADKTAAELTLADEAKLADALSVKRQQDHYILRAGAASFMMPGLGQFMVGQPLQGSLFMGAQVAVMAGTMFGVHYLLPASLAATMGDRDAMRGLMFSGNFMAALPAMGVMAGGMTLSAINMLMASTSASKAARDQVGSGKVSFEPRLMSSRSGMGMGFGFGF